MDDFEVGLEHYPALSANCNFIITEDINDFYFSEISVLKARDFFKKHLAKS